MARHTTSLHCSPAEPHPPPPADAGRSLRAPADSRCSPAADNGFCSRSSWAEYSPPTKAGHLPARWEERGAAGRRPGWARRPAPPLRNPARPRSASQGSPRGGTAPAERRERVEGPLATPRTPPAAAPWHSTTRRRHRRPTAGAAPQLRPPPSRSAEGEGRGNGRAAAGTHFVQHLEDNEGEKGESARPAHRGPPRPAPHSPRGWSPWAATPWLRTEAACAPLRQCSQHGTAPPAHRSELPSRRCGAEPPTGRYIEAGRPTPRRRGGRGRSSAGRTPARRCGESARSGRLPPAVPGRRVRSHGPRTDPTPLPGTGSPGPACQWPVAVSG